jgi:hypothetical protein
METSPHPDRRWRRGLFIAFFLALFMGAGPGLYLVNGYAAAGGTFAGVPALYAWALGWCAVEAVIVLIAYLKVWRHEA